MTNKITHRATYSGGSAFSGPRTLVVRELGADGKEPAPKRTLDLPGGVLTDRDVDAELKAYGLARVGEWAPPSGSWSFGVLTADLRRV